MLKKKLPFLTPTPALGIASGDKGKKQQNTLMQKVSLHVH
jgi:hypothetical protein